MSDQPKPVTLDAVDEDQLYDFQIAFREKLPPEYTDNQYPHRISIDQRIVLLTNLRMPVIEVVMQFDHMDGESPDIALYNTALDLFIKLSEYLSGAKQTQEDIERNGEKEMIVGLDLRTESNQSTLFSMINLFGFYDVKPEILKMVEQQKSQTKKKKPLRVA